MRIIEIEDPCLYCKKYQPCGCARDKEVRAMRDSEIARQRIESSLANPQTPGTCGL